MRTSRAAKRFFSVPSALAAIAVAAIVACAPLRAAAAGAGGAAKPAVTRVDFLARAGLAVNGAGPLLVKIDPARNRLVAANTLSSSISIVDCASGAVENIPLEGRALQHLKAEALAIRAKTGEIYLVGSRCFSIVDPAAKRARTIRTPAQFESIAVDEETGNVFVAGRESAELGFWPAGSGKLRLLPWRSTREDLVNLNASPPPPIRRVVAASELGRIVAIDGYTSTLHLFDARNGKALGSRPLGLTSGGRWHLAGYDPGTHRLYLVIETVDRRVIEAARIDVAGGGDSVVPLPSYTEGVGVAYNPAREEVYVPYDNHASVHVVDWKAGGAVAEIRIPAYGNDASAVDERNGILYIGSWAHGEIDVIDLASRSLATRIEDLGIIPHQFSMAFNPNDGLLYFPKGASAVNGTFGAAVTVLDPAEGMVEKIRTGWAPIDLVEVPSRGSFLVFDNEDEFAEVWPDGRFETRRLPFDYPVEAVLAPGGNVYLSYGPHQSYWPVVYIWGAKNGVLRIDARDLSFYDRRIPRQAHRMVFDSAGMLYFTQNNWGAEEQFIGTIPDEVRLFEIGQRIALGDTVDRETTQRILEYDAGTNRLYLARLPEKDGNPSILQIVDPSAKKVVHRMTVGLTATDLVFDEKRIYVSNFDSRSVTAIDKATFAATEIPVGAQPLALCRLGGSIWAANHGDGTVQEVRPGAKARRLPFDGRPDNLCEWNGRLVVTAHGAGSFHVAELDPATGAWTVLVEEKYPYGDTRFDSRNAAFFMPGQFGDAVFAISRIQAASDGSLWVTDFLSGRLFIVEGRTRP